MLPRKYYTIIFATGQLLIFWVIRAAAVVQDRFDDQKARKEPGHLLAGLFSGS
jgi:hypothetical protein